MSKHRKNLPPFAQLVPKPAQTLAQFAITAQHFSGPIPPPEMMRKYEELLPGFANRIMSMAEGQSTHRQTLEAKVVSSNCANERIGMVFGFVICVLAISTGAFLVLHGKSASGLASILTALAAPLAVFIYGKSRQQRELQARQQGIIEAARNTQVR